MNSFKYKYPNEVSWGLVHEWWQDGKEDWCGLYSDSQGKETSGKNELLKWGLCAQRVHLKDACSNIGSLLCWKSAHRGALGIL